MKTQAEIADLKRQWEADPHWDLSGTEGFEEHREELEAHEIAYWAEWERARQRDQREHRERALGVNHLEAAKIAALNANLISRPTDPAEELRYATMHAAIAQAEAATRIAEVLETMLEAQTPATAPALEHVARAEVRCDCSEDDCQSVAYIDHCMISIESEGGIQTIALPDGYGVYRTRGEAKS